MRIKNICLSIVLSVVASSSAFADSTVACQGTRTNAKGVVISDLGIGTLSSDGSHFQVDFSKKLSFLHAFMAGDIWTNSKQYALDTWITEDKNGSYAATNITFDSFAVAKKSILNSLKRGFLSYLVVNGSTTSSLEYRITCDPLK